MSTPPTQPRIPYGEADFRRIRLNRWRCVDKTRFLQRLEEERYAFLIRPRRFGKSLGVSVLENYYDRFWADGFAGTDIGQDPTGEQSRYVTLRFDFSNVNDALDTLEREFTPSPTAEFLSEAMARQTGIRDYIGGETVMAPRAGRWDS